MLSQSLFDQVGFHLVAVQFGWRSVCTGRMVKTAQLWNKGNNHEPGFNNGRKYAASPSPDVLSSSFSQ